MAGMSQWNYADVWEVIARRLPDAPALQHGALVRSWREFNARANGVARELIDAGLREHDKVAQYLYNGPEYTESWFACFKAGLVPVNTNYRYGDEELCYLFDNADAAAVFFHASFGERVARIRPRLPGVRLWVCVDDGTDTCPDFAVRYESVTDHRGDDVRGAWGRSPDHLFFLYTGGTTGMPKGVMWRQDDIFGLMNRSATRRYPDDGSLDDVVALVDSPGAVHLCACPLMHGTGAVTSLATLGQGGSIVTLTNRHFDAVEFLDAIDAHGATTAAIVGDAFGRPIVDALDAEPGRWSLASLFAVLSSGVKWSDEVKAAMLRHQPDMLLVDVLGSSEALGAGRSVATARDDGNRGRFTLGPNTRVITEDGRDVEPGSGEIGLVAMSGRNPVGYYKDPAKSAATFPVIDGRRYTILGDHATVDADGTINLLGRGSAVINSGGEKIFPEEVENEIRKHADVADVAVVGLPDARFGEIVCALVAPRSGRRVDGAAITAHVKAHLAGYKAPRRVWPVEFIERGPNGKLDYKRQREIASALYESEKQ